MARTQTNFENHQLTIKELDGIIIYTFKKPDTIEQQLIFIIGYDVTTVTGDFGNWVFNREFTPALNGTVSDDYWDEKLQSASRQEIEHFDSDDTAEKIMEFCSTFEEKFGREMNEAEGEWIEQLETYADDEVDYMYMFNKHYPTETLNSEDTEILITFARSHCLKVIYDAFDVMCSRMEK